MHVYPPNEAPLNTSPSNDLVRLTAIVSLYQSILIIKMNTLYSYNDIVGFTKPNCIETQNTRLLIRVKIYKELDTNKI